MNRRRFLVGGATAAGALVVGYAVWPSHILERADQLGSKPGERFLANWLKIANDDTVTVVIPHCDMGTGIFTPLAQMAADELDADWTKVRTETAPADPAFANGAMAEGFALDQIDVAPDSIPAALRGTTGKSLRILAEFMDLQTTGGSCAVRYTGVYGMRVAGAAAREMLLKAAASRMNTSTDAFHTESNRVIHTASGNSFTYGELAADAARYTPSAHPKLKTRGEFKIIGKPAKRLDIPSKVNGSLRYGIDTAVPGMMYAAIRIAPVPGGKLVSVNEASVSQRRGVKKIVRLEDAVVAVADSFWAAKSAVAALEATFDSAGKGDVASKTIRELHLAALSNGKVKKDMAKGQGLDALKNATMIERTYNVPYLAHAPMEPANATALYKQSGTLEVWSGTQDGLGSRAFCAKAAGISLEKVTFHLLPSGGGFGRRLPGLWNFLTYSVKTAMAMPGVPIKLLFTREDEMRHEYYRPNVTSRFRAAVDSAGLPTAWVHDYTTDADPNAEAHIIYNVPNQFYGTVKVPVHIPTGPWRSVEASWHGFFVESFVDELAHSAHRDPVEFRRALLQDQPRHLATLNLAAEKSGWGAPLPPGHGRGVAVFECFGTIVCHVVHVEVTDAGGVIVHGITTAADCGMAVNPDGFKAQMEGGAIFGLSAALLGEITIDHGAVVQRNFDDYPVVRMNECPTLDVNVQESDAPLGGAGEPGIPPVAPAVTNAIFAATGVRIRELPVKNHSLATSARRQET
jgi:isoquinoline 1-oxidoreductase subunit beta